MSSRLELYHWEPNTYFLKPLIALEEKGAKYDTEITDPGDAAVRAEYLKVNRLGKVPFVFRIEQYFVQAGESFDHGVLTGIERENLVILSVVDQPLFAAPDLGL